MTDLLPCPFCGTDLLLHNHLRRRATDYQGVLYEHPASDCYLAGFQLDGANTEQWNRRSLRSPVSEKRRLDKPAQVGGGIFHVGVEERLVIECAQRQYEFQQQPEQQADRAKRVAEFRQALRESAAPRGDQPNFDYASTIKYAEANGLPIEFPSAAPQGEAVAWLHDGEDRVDVIHNKVKTLWEKIDAKHVEHYTIPLYLSPAQSAQAVKWSELKREGER